MGLTRTQRLLIALIVVAAIVARAFAFSPFASHHPDETIQYLEQAHRLVFGVGILPWEYKLGMRSWLVPGLLAGPMWLGDRIAPGTTLYVVLPRLLFAGIALVPLWAAWTIAARISRRHGLIALAVMALWYESVYFSVHVLTETMAVSLFLPAAALLLGERTRARLAMAGGLLGFAVLFRFHYAPAIAVFATLTLRTRWREWGWLALGGAVPLLVSAGIDIAVGQWPLGWVIENVRHNVVEDKAAQFGEFGMLAYGQMLWLAWSFMLIPILWLAAPGARRFPALAIAAAVNVAVHLLIGHKEYRFILLSTQIVVLLAAIGSVDVVAGLRRGLGTKAPSRNAMLAGLAVAWGLASATLAASDLADPGWRRQDAGYRLLREAAQRQACGVAIFHGPSYPAWGSLWLHNDTPQYYFLGPDRAGERRNAAALSYSFNAIVADPSRIDLPGFTQRACEGNGADRACLAMRPGPCRRDAASDHWLLQRVMERNQR